MAGVDVGLDACVGTVDGVSVQSFAPSLADDLMPLMLRIAPRPMLMLLASDDTAGLTNSQLAAYQAVAGPKSLKVYAGHHYSLCTRWKAHALAAAVDWFSTYLSASPQ